MTKNDIDKEIVRRTNIPLAKVQHVTAEMLAIIVGAVADGESVALPNFGRFHHRVIHHRPYRSGIGGKVVTKPYNVVGFRLAQAFKNALKEKQDGQE